MPQRARSDLIRDVFDPTNWSVILAAGADPNAYNPKGMHEHATPLHGACGSGYVRLAALLLSRGARTDIRDTLWDGTARDWAEHGAQYEALGLLDAHEAHPG